MASKITSETIKLIGAALIPGSRDQKLKIELKRFNGNTGLDIRAWYKPDEEKWNAMDPSQKAGADDKGYLPGKGIFMNPVVAAWVVKKLHGLEADETFAKLVAEAKDATKSKEEPAKIDAKALEAKIRKELEDKLRKELEEKLRKELTASAKPAAKPEADGAEDLEEVNIPESSVTAPTKRSRKR